MLPYPELVKKARELHNRLGEPKFRELYEKHPSSLVMDLGVVARSTRRNRAGKSVLQAFDFYPLDETVSNAYGRIREMHRAKQAHLLHSAAYDSDMLRILEARGLLKLRKGSMGKARRRLVITEVFDNGVWKKVAAPVK